VTLRTYASIVLQKRAFGFSELSLKLLLNLLVLQGNDLFDEKSRVGPLLKVTLKR
jgi:hypothetical protein